ncbi:MAG: protein kinase [Gemmatimonadales bacterium]
MNFSRIESLFEGALALPPGERAAWLRDRCGDDPALLREVEQMLAAHERPQGILERLLAPEPFDLPVHLGRALAGKYTLISPLGTGGMATVFLAEEHKHGRRVVLKVLKPEIAALLGPERFQREVQIAARLAHPHVLGLIDSGEAGGLLFYVMPYVEGETLRARLRRQGRLPLGESLALLRDIADALAHAHRAGIVHRDLKPENVLCVGGHAFLMDFGIAKLLREADESGRLTDFGVRVGTPGYMAPEQAAGDPALDHRADIYALGLLACEMLAGQAPVTRGARGSVRLPVFPAETPADLVDLIEACLDPDPGLRVDSAALVVSRLEEFTVPTPPATLVERAPARWPWVVFAGAAALAVIAWVLFRGTPAATLRAPVAVSALINETGDSTLSIWGRLAGDWITQGLQETGLVPVVPWPSALQASERMAQNRAAGMVVDPVGLMRAETGAGTVVTGAYYQVGNELRFQVEVTDAVTGALLGALQPVVASVDSPQTAVRVLRDRLMGSMAIWSDERFALVPGLARNPPLFDAYRATDRGLNLFVNQEYQEAAVEFRRAYALDTTFLAPLIYAAAGYWNDGEFARAESLLAALDDRRTELNSYQELYVDYLTAFLQGDLTRGYQAIRQAASMAPESKATYNLAIIAIRINRPAEAVAALEGLDPDRSAMRGWSPYWSQYSHALHMVGRHERELEVTREMLKRFPDRRAGWVLSARALAARGRTSAIDSLLAASATLPPRTYWSQAAAMVVAGEELRAHGYETPADRYLERALEWLATQIDHDPDYAPYRYWQASAFYDLRRWEEAEQAFGRISAADTADLQSRGLRVLAAAHRDPRAVGETDLGAAPRHDLGAHTLFRARLAAVQGDTERAISLLSEALKQGVNGLQWVHASGYHDFVALRGDERFRALMGK